MIRSLAKAYPQSQLDKTMTEGIPPSFTQQSIINIYLPSQFPRFKPNIQTPTKPKFDRIKPTKRHLFTNTRVRAYKARLAEPLQDDSKSLAISIFKSANSMLGIIEPTPPKSILHTHINSSLSLWFLTKNNLEAIGVFLNEKSKIATIVQSRHQFNIGLTYFSPTENSISLFFVPIAARSTRMISTFTNVELDCFKIPIKTEIVIRLNKNFGMSYIKRFYHLKQSINKDLSPTSQLLRNQYGLREPRQFNSLELTMTPNNKLTSIELVQAQADQCISLKISRPGIVDLKGHMDRRLQMASLSEFQTWDEELRRAWYQIYIQHAKITYLEMCTKISTGSIQFQHAEPIDNTVTEYRTNISPRSDLPTGKRFLEDNQINDEVDQSKDRGMSMSHMKLGRLTQADDHIPAAGLSTNSASQKKSYYTNLFKLISQSATTSSRSIHLKGNAILTSKMYSDTAHMFHKDGNGRREYFGTIESVTIFTTSDTTKLVSRSSVIDFVMCLTWLTSLHRDLKVSCETYYYLYL
jgi:hypothetical protein